jgi:hypothetical protein
MQEEKTFILEEQFVLISLFQRIIQERTREGRVELGDTGNARCGKFLEQR